MAALQGLRAMLTEHVEGGLYERLQARLMDQATARVEEHMRLVNATLQRMAAAIKSSHEMLWKEPGGATTLAVREGDRATVTVRRVRQVAGLLLTSAMSLTSAVAGCLLPVRRLPRSS